MKRSTSPGGLKVIGESTAFRSVERLIDKMARYDVPVLIGGETGTGKELAARAIHYQSARHDRPFVPVNCGALPDSLIESELFGHRRGAFTDAREDHPGLVAIANSGTLFLDEVDALTPKAQVTLLRFLQDQQYRPIGGRSLERADVRVIAASNTSLDDLVGAKRFRIDLLYRLKLMQLQLPPLRERKGDIEVLSRHFLQVGALFFSWAVGAPRTEGHCALCGTWSRDSRHGVPPKRGGGAPAGGGKLTLKMLSAFDAR